MPGEQGRFEEFYRATYARTVTIVLHQCGDHTQAEDLTQEAYARCFARWDRVQHYVNPHAWVIGVALREGISRRRRISTMIRRRHLVDPAEMNRPGIDEVVTRLDTLGMLARLPEKQRAVSLLFYLVDQSVEQIGELMNISPSAVKTHLSRARRSLTEIVEGERHVQF